MENVREQIARWAKEGQSLHSPSWEELPSIPLYMDQVILYLGENLRFFEQDGGAGPLTSSMINNYVKSGVVPHPEKKKYRKGHLGALMTVCLLKRSLSIQDIKTLLSEGEITPQFYSLLQQAHTDAARSVCKELEQACENGQDLRETALRFAIEAGAKQAAAQRILQELAGEKTGEKEKKGKKQAETERPA